MADKVNKKSAPRREVVKIDKEGPWGRIEYVHTLSCGHQERRKRATTTKVLACSWCVVAEKEHERLQGLSTSQRQADITDEIQDAFHSQIAVSESEIAKLRAALSHRFGIPLDSIDIAITDEDGRLSISYAVIFLSAHEIFGVLQSDKNDS